MDSPGQISAASPIPTPQLSLLLLMALPSPGCGAVPRLRFGALPSSTPPTARTGLLSASDNESLEVGSSPVWRCPVPATSALEVFSAAAGLTGRALLWKASSEDQS